MAVYHLQLIKKCNIKDSQKEEEDRTDKPHP